jgi:hypothetical protein
VQRRRVIVFLVEANAVAGHDTGRIACLARRALAPLTRFRASSRAASASAASSSMR